ncbi:MAG: hypothetical protein WCO56_26770 [Verrucomicrobiota bacterium]
MPPNVPVDKVAQYESAAEAIAEGGSGALPNGSDYKPNDQPRGVNPFKEYLAYFTEKLVMAGTGGLLTVLTQSGSGTLAGSAHMEAFRTIARHESRKINGVMQADFDAEVLGRAFPGKPKYAYFELAATEAKTVGEVVDHVGKLSQAGYQMPAEEVTELTGYEVTEKIADSGLRKAELGPAKDAKILQKNKPAEKLGQDGQDGQDEDQEDLNAEGEDGTLENRGPAKAGTTNQSPDEGIEPLLASARDAFAQAQARALAPLRERILAITKLSGTEQAAALSRLRGELPGMLGKMNVAPETAKVLEQALAAGVASGGTLQIENCKLKIGNRERHEGLILNGAPFGHPFYGNQHVSGKELGDLYEAAKTQAGNATKVSTYQTVSDAEAEKIKASTGLNVSGYVHAVDTYSLKHIHNSHGNPEKEAARGQVHVTREDIEKIPEIVQHADKIEYGGKTKLGREAIRYTKKMGPNTILIEEVRTKQKLLIPASFMKFKN